MMSCEKGPFSQLTKVNEVELTQFDEPIYQWKGN